MDDSTLRKGVRKQEPDGIDIGDEEYITDASDGSQDTESNSSDRKEDKNSDQPKNSDKIIRDRHHITPKPFSFQQLDLKLRCNITALSNAAKQTPKQSYGLDDSGETFATWLDKALVAISPNADMVLFSTHSPDRIVFFAKLRVGSVDHYITKKLDISLDYDEQITSLLCLPIMSTQRTSSGSIDWTALVLGLSSGYVKFYTEQSICLLSLKYCDEPVVSLKCQTQKNPSNARSQTHFASIVDELLVVHQTQAIIIDGIGLYENMRISKEEVVRSESRYEPAYSVADLPTILNCQRWKIEDSRTAQVYDADLFGIRCSTRFDALKSESINSDYVPIKTNARALTFVGSDPFVARYREAKETTSHSYTEILGSLLPFWNKPQPSKLQINDISNSNVSSLFDRGRLGTSIVSSPDKRLAAITDDFGRVLLVDITNWLIIRIWKGYRSAQCGWIEVKRNPEVQNSPCAYFLVIYAPKRGLLEIWSSQRGPRVTAFNVGKNCRLLYSGYRMLNMRAEMAQRGSGVNLQVDRSYSSNCYLLNARSETIFSIEVPYTYSLYKFGDLKSRDHLLIGELINAIQQDYDTNSISEILHRISLAESLESAIQKISSGFLPSKIIPILENLILKTMKNYDNQIGETMTDDDMSIMELCKRIIRLCSLFNDLLKSSPTDLSLPDVNQRLIDHYEEHPQEVDEFAEQLGWSATEVLRYLSLLALERSYKKDHLQNPWPNLGEPLGWPEFIACFDLNRINYGLKSNKSVKGGKSLDKLSIKLRNNSKKFLHDDKVVKTSLFLYNRLSENFYKYSTNRDECPPSDNYNYIEPSSRLILLFQFWLSSKLCNHWKMWAFLQKHVGLISDELKVLAMNDDDDRILIESWQQVYNLILESDNLFAALISTATIRSDTLRTLEDNEKREKIDKEPEEPDEESRQRRSSVDWECLCIDAERMSILSQQLEDVFLLNLLLRYSPQEGHLIDNYQYRVARMSVANILRGGPTVVSELIAQWSAQSKVDMKIFIQPYGEISQDDTDRVVIASLPGRQRSRFYSRTPNLNNNEHAKELLHHAKASFPCSLDADIILMNCLWEFCRRWVNTTMTNEKSSLLKRISESLELLSNVRLRENLASLAFKTFFHRTFERLVFLVEKNATILDAKNLRSRDNLFRKELNIGDDCVEEFIQFCCDLSELMLQNCSETNKLNNEDEDAYRAEIELRDRLLTPDDWWSTPSAVKMLDEQNSLMGYANREPVSSFDLLNNSLTVAAISNSKLLDMNTLIELNRLASLMNLVYKLKVVRAYPLSLIGDESRQALKFDLQQSPTTGADLKTRSGSLAALRHKFARKCIINIVAKMSEDMNDIGLEEEYGKDCGSDNDVEDVDTSKQQSSTIKGNSSSSSTSLANKQKPIASGAFSGSRSKAGLSKTITTTTRASGMDVKKTVASTMMTMDNNMDNDDEVEQRLRYDNNESMIMFANLLSLVAEWQLDCDELHLELVFELYRCNHDKLAGQISTRVNDHEALANGLLKISAQRVLVLFGLSPQTSASSSWRTRSDKWSMFYPNVASWLKSIQQEEMRRELAPLSFCDSWRWQQQQQHQQQQQNPPQKRQQPTSSGEPFEAQFGVQIFVLHALRHRSKLLLESATNYLENEAGRRLAYDLLQLLESQVFDKFLIEERNLWQKASSLSSSSFSMEATERSQDETVETSE